MNVCILAPFRVLPAIDGASSRVMEISTGLCNAGVSVVLLHAGASKWSQDGLRIVGFTALENISIRGFLWSRALDAYLSSVNFALYCTLMRVIKSMKIDILQIEGPWSIFAAQIVRAIGGGLPVVYDSHNVEALANRFSSSAPWMAPFVTLAEKEAAKRSDAVFCVSELDKARMCSLYRLPLSKIFVVPNGVHNSGYRAATGGQIRHRLGLGVDTKIVFFHGSLRWKPNFEAAETIVESLAPSFERDSQETVFLVAGPYPSKRLLTRANQRPNVRVLGYVPNIEEYICAADICIAPMKSGSGTKLKILEYLAAGKPVIATRMAVEGMGIRDGVEALVFDDAGEEFIRAIRDISPSQFSRRLGEKARAFAEPFEWSAITKKITGIYESLLTS